MNGWTRRRPSPTPDLPAVDPLAAFAWRYGRSLGPRGADLLLRFVPDRAFAGVVRRLAAMGVEDAVAADALGRVRRLGDWSDAWMVSAQRALGEARMAAKAGEIDAEALANKQAALAFHAASWPPPDARTLRTLRASAASLFAEAVAVLDPGIRRLDIRWRTQRLPALLAYPPGTGRAAPLVIVLNGATTAKEEVIAWAGPFVRRGMAVLALDWPGTGEVIGLPAPTADDDDLLDGVLDALAADPAVDTRRAACVGPSLGGALAVRLGAAERNVRAVVAVTPPFAARAWLPRVGPLLQEHLVAHAGGLDRLNEIAESFALSSFAGRNRPPLLVFGAGRDLIVPPMEAVRLAAAMGDDATLAWYPQGGHALFDAVPAWTADAAAWLGAILETPSTRVDSRSTPFDITSNPPSIRSNATADSGK